MNSENKWLSFEEARQTDMIDYLLKLGHEPVKVRNCNYWYLSPLREEKTASFKVNKVLNRWYDHGLGKGGNIIDFGIAYHHCTIGKLLLQFTIDFSFHQPILRQSQEQLKESGESKIKIIKEGVLSSFALVHYLHERRIPIDIAERFCKEVKYELNVKNILVSDLKTTPVAMKFVTLILKPAVHQKTLLRSTIMLKKLPCLKALQTFFPSWLSIKISSKTPLIL